MSVLDPTRAGMISRQDQRFLLHEWLDVERLCERPRFEGHSRSTIDDTLDLAEDLAGSHFAPHLRTADAVEPRIGESGRVELLEDVGAALTAFNEAGMVGAAMDESVGGLQLPQVVATAAFSWFQAANPSTAAYPFLTMGAANMLAASGSPEQRATWVAPMVEGRYFGTMCLSETQAGSSLADVATRAIAQEDGTYRVFGTKMWISGGEHELTDNIVHLVLARIPGGPPGVKGISLFIVPRFLLDADGAEGEPNDVVLAGLNHKMGFRGIVNTVLGFGEGTHRPGGVDGAVGYLVGEPHKGLTYMFHMMNEARLGVGLSAACIGYAGYLKSVRYARERPQGRDRQARGTGPQLPIVRHADVKRMLLAQKSYVEGGLALVLYSARLVDEQRTAPDAAARERAGLLLDVLTPIAKSWPAQWGVVANDIAIQVHGGYGYAREYDVEQHYRDNRLNSIHEGTHGIQALDLLGRKVTMQDGAAFSALLATVIATIDRARAAGGAAERHAAQLENAVDRLVAVTSQVQAQADAELALANATAYLEAAGHVVVAWIWLEQELAAGDRDEAFYAGKRQAAAYFFGYELPKVYAQFDLVERMDDTTLTMQDAWF